MSEFIGSRISLISKSDIKYIGTLHEINSDTSTVALENVTSYGTEGRKGNPAEEIPGSDQIYEYIVFRGSDVKALNIVEAPKENAPPAPVPNDPAILGSARPTPQNQQQPPQHQHQHNQQFRGPPAQHYPPYGFPPQGPPQHQFQQPPRFQGGSGAHGFPGAPGAVPGYGAPPPGYGGPPPGYGPMGYGPPPGHGFQGPPPGHFSPANQQPIGPPGQHMNQQRPPQQQQGQQQAPIGSKQATPQPATSQAPPPPPGLQAPPQPQKPVEMSTTPAPPTKPSPAGQGPPPPMESKPSPAEATAPSSGRDTRPGPPPKSASRAGNRVAVPLPSPNTAAAKPQPRQTPGAASQAPPAAVAQPTQAYADATQAATAAVAAAMAKLGPANNQSRNDSRAQTTDGALDNLTQKVNQMRVDGQQQRGRGRGRGRGEGRGGRGDGAHRGGRRQNATQAIDVPKEDYDFDAANAKFNKQDLVKEAIATGSPVTSPTKTNGTVANPLENGHANGAEADAEDVVIPAASEKGYDKKSSFFDNISSDLKDRIEQQQSEQSFDGRAMRNQERSRNVETFGQGSVDNGGYRGSRGRGRGRGYGRGGRGYSGEGQRGARALP